MGSRVRQPLASLLLTCDAAPPPGPVLSRLHLALQHLLTHDDVSLTN